MTVNRFSWPGKRTCFSKADLKLSIVMVKKKTHLNAWPKGESKNPPISWDQEQVWEPCLFTFRFQCLGKKNFFFWDIGYVTKHRGILRIDLESNGNDETKIYTYLFFWNFHDRIHGGKLESWIQNTILHCLMKMSLKHSKSFFFLFR